ncbi:MAG TPA: reducing hydrogenase subunit alpha [Propionibacteriaceae bacterium]|nr:reducing hydrogenase subunit alpha [Propionibacteriaceae bacterium]
MTQRWVLDEIVDPFGAKIVVERDAVGAVRSARFDLAGLPRVDALLSGQQTAEVPDLVEKLCGICPAAHHLAGVRALEALAGLDDITPTAKAVRRLLHLGSALETHAPRLLATDREAAVALKRFGKAAMVASGSPGHFPITAIPGGVRAVVTSEARDDLAARVADVLALTIRVAEQELDRSTTLPVFSGADVALVNTDGGPDVLGRRIRAVTAQGATLISGAAASAWDMLVAEEFPGRAAPRPFLMALGPGQGRYRVGPVAQLRVGELSTPIAATLQTQWLLSNGDAAGARAVMCVQAAEEIALLLDNPALSSGEVSVPVGDFQPGAIGVGWVDGPRGLLVHRYQAGEDGRLATAQILTPTAQNEAWLAELLTATATDSTDPLGMEDAVREADPCLPCSSAPVGGMGLQVDTVSVEGRN